MLKVTTETNLNFYWASFEDLEVFLIPSVLFFVTIIFAEALVEEHTPPSYPGLYRSSSMDMLTSVDDFADATSAPPPAYAKAVVMATSSVDSTLSPLDRRVEQFKQAQVRPWTIFLKYQCKLSRSRMMKL